MQAEAFDVIRGKNQIVPERNFVPEKSNFATGGITPGSKLTLLVVLAVVRQKCFWNDSENFTSINHHRAVEQLSIEPQRRPHKNDREKIFALPHHFAHRVDARL